mmetsp:Transcript_9260/g.34253  ORF Transcript_9260/g.34253 Transcript_9260/m.34253 type:complete len:960 (-) Transcript_9260:753-3632(-)|eukprot:CAMPEP_0117435044 /NCGR_PEP_ID=MMETSP0759-20121206/269_1 /TAXON_ID=63605 /ORGANISM="Percolomonas cosmopolitus, Strain WS" /LENGTH=959 /DNA_ID=CAMNT_0005226561 /DNA_START=91 /DNA_END=2970 /DNA_ORIENTATION=+
MLVFFLPATYIIEISVLLLPLIAIVLFHTPTYNKILSLLDQIGLLTHEFSSTFMHIENAWKTKYLGAPGGSEKLQSPTSSTQKRKRKSHKRRSGAAGNISPFLLSRPSGIEQETQVTPRELESIGVRTTVPMIPYYYRSLDTAKNHVLSAYNDGLEDPEFADLIPRDIVLTTQEVQTDAIRFPDMGEAQITTDTDTPDTSPQDTSNTNARHRFHSLDTYTISTQTNISGEVLPSGNVEKKNKSSFQICAWSSEVESVNFHSHMHRTVRRYLEQYIPCASSGNHHLILTNKDAKLVLDRRSLRKIPLELIEQPVNLTFLDLSHNVLSELPDWFFEACKTLQHLDLSYNYFYDLPYNLRLMRKLKELNLSHNRLQTFPQALCHLPNLASLDLSHNSIGLVPNNIRLLRSHITHLDISHNCLINLPFDFVQLKKLKYLGYEGNSFVYTTRSDVLKYFDPVHKKDSMQKDSVSSTSDTPPQKPLSMGGLGVVPSSQVFELTPKDSSVFSNNLKEDFSGQDTRALTILELFENEQVYLRHLNVLFEVYYIPLTKFFRDIAKQYDIHGGVGGVNPEDVNKILPIEIYSIITFTRSLFIELKEAMGSYESDPIMLEKVPIGQIFSKHKEFFMEHYVPFIKRFESSTKALQDLCKHSSQFAKFIQSRESLIICDGLEISAFLALPLQRLFFYHRTMRNLLKLTPQKHCDYEHIANAVKMLSECLSAQKQEMSKYDDKYKIVNIEKKLNLELLKPGRLLLHEGRLTLAPTQELGKLKNEVVQHMKKREKSKFKDKMKLNPYIDIFLNKIRDKTAGDVMNDLWSLRLTELSVYAYLFNDLLVIKETNLLQKLVSGAHSYDLAGVRLHKSVDPDEPEFILEFRNTHNMKFRCETQKEATEWIHVIESALAHLVNRGERFSHESMDLDFSEEDDISFGEEIAFGEDPAVTGPFVGDDDDGSIMESVDSDIE